MGLLFALTLLITSCSENGEEVTGSADQSVVISASEFDAVKGSGKITYMADVGTAWSAEVTEGDDFVSFSITSTKSTIEGEVVSSGANTLYFYYSSNSYVVDRTAKISFAFEGAEAVEFSIKQLSSISEDSPYVSGTLAPRWAEIPEWDDDENYLYVTHSTSTTSGEAVRNFSLCFDVQNRAAAWVAYPYHSIYDGSVGRNEDWDYDPKIPTSYQANLSSSYGSYGGNSYDRGHQMASNDRQATVSMNKQTFYYSNMTPQLSSLNQGMWKSLEAAVLKQVCVDTLFVVTGADFSPVIGYTTDNSGKSCAIPSAYYKVLLRTRIGFTGKAVSECSASELQAIGFWVEHEAQSDIPSPVSVQEIEQKSGFTFFPGIPDEVKASYTLSDWNF